ncbi:MAG: SRPBCC family protein [Candidatus Parabeggiatoa sp.]|nr:SRPBCC family protein [Candidatus Parabeggiatoa sp.]
MKTTSHTVTCHAPANKIYQIISDVQRWVGLFELAREVSIVGKGEQHEIVRITAKIDDVDTTWLSHRKFFPEIFGIDFEILTPMPLVESMHGHWRVIPLESGSSLLLIEHHFVIKGNVEGLIEGVHTREEATDFMLRAIENNAWRDLARTKVFVEENAQEKAPLRHAFSSSQTIAAPIADIYQLLAEVESWPNLLPHCDAVDLLYNEGGYQEFVMNVSTPHGKERFRSIRICRDNIFSIEYFQPEPPPVLKLHRGAWVLQSVPEGTNIIASHEIQIDPEACQRVFGNDNIESHKENISQAIEKNSLMTLEACKQHLLGMVTK